MRIVRQWLPLLLGAAVLAACFLSLVSVAAPTRIGDVNGDNAVDSTDARLILQYYAKMIPADGLDLAAADVDGDGAVDSTDARLVLQYYAKMITVFPVSADPSATREGETTTAYIPSTTQGSTPSTTREGETTTAYIPSTTKGSTPTTTTAKTLPDPTTGPRVTSPTTPTTKATGIVFPTVVF